MCALAIEHHDSFEETYFSICPLISAGSSTPLVLVALIISLTSSACVMVFLAFMIRTIAA